MTDQQSSLSTRWLTLTTADGPMHVYEARPHAAVSCAVIVLQEAFGVNDHIQDVVRRLGARGYLALAPDLFHRTGVTELGYDEHTEAMRLIGEIGPAQITADTHAVIEHLRAEEGIDAERTAVTGFCFGGRAAFTTATRTPGLAAVVVFYGPGIVTGPHAMLDRAGDITAPLLSHVGSEDPTIPAEHAAQIDHALRRNGVEFSQHVYPGAGHAFACDARPQMYRQEAAETAWRRTYEFLDRQLLGEAELRGRD